MVAGAEVRREELVLFGDAAELLEQGGLGGGRTERQRPAQRDGLGHRAVGERVVATRNVSATIISVRRDGNSTLAEINAGSRDGLQTGWTMTIGDGSTFIGNLRITEVDVNRCVGVVELEDRAARGEVKVGQRAIARSGE